MTHLIVTPMPHSCVTLTMKIIFNDKGVALSVFSLILLITVFIFSNFIGVYMDDAYIYFRVARHVLQGEGPVFNPGDTHFPITSPLWLYTLVTFKGFFPFFELPLLSKLIFIILLSLASVFCFFTFRKYIGMFAGFCPVFIFFNYISVSCVGGEIGLVYLGLFGFLWAYFQKQNFYMVGLFLAIGYLARGEMVMLVIPLAIHYGIDIWKQRRTVGEGFRDLGRLLLVAVPPVILWHSYFYLQFGSFFPSTLGIKILQGQSGKWTLFSTFHAYHWHWLLERDVALVILLLVGFFSFRWIAFVFLGFYSLHYFVYSILHIPNYHWYYYNLYILPLFLFMGIFHLWLKYRKKVEESPFIPFKKITQMVMVVLVVVLGVKSIVQSSLVTRVGNYQTDQRYGPYRKAAQWIMENTRKGDVVLAEEVGILGYYLPHLMIRDNVGITSTMVEVDNIKDMEHFVKLYSPKVVFSISNHRDIRYFNIGDKIAVFKRAFSAQKKGKYKACCFLFQKWIPPDSSFSRLAQLRKEMKGSINYDIFRYKNNFRLFSHGNMASHLDNEPDSVGLSINFGLMEQLIKLKPENEDADGVIFKIYGVRGREHNLLFSKGISPPFDSIDKLRTSATIYWGKVKYDRILLKVVQKDNNVLDRIYWESPKFVFNVPAR